MINFPAFHITLNIDKVAFELFGIKIYYYAICIVLGIVISMLLCSKNKNNFGVKFDFIFESLIHALIIGFLGARIYYVAFNLDDYITSPMSILNIRDGGLAIYGGLIAGGIVIYKRCKKYNVNELDFFDNFTPFVALAQSIGRWGNFFNREAYGTETSSLFRMGINTNYRIQGSSSYFFIRIICHIYDIYFFNIGAEKKKI